MRRFFDFVLRTPLRMTDLEVHNVENGIFWPMVSIGNNKLLGEILQNLIQLFFPDVGVVDHQLVVLFLRHGAVVIAA